MSMIFTLILLFIPTPTHGSNLSCYCDVIRNYCENACCCDADCTSCQLRLFAGCKETHLKDALQLCEHLGADGTNYPLCIYSKNKNFDYPAESVVRSTSLSNHLEYIGLYSTGVSIQISYSVNEVTPLFIPQSNQVSCDMLPVGFAQSVVSYCTWNLEDIESTVNFDTAKIKCNRLGDVLLTVRDSTILGKMKLSEIDSEQIIPILTCYGQNTNTPILCPTTTPKTIVDNSNVTICSNVPISVYFKITYEIIGKITQFELYAIIGNVTKIFTQKYEVEFVQVNTSNVLPMSGNPGYLIGRPIVGAKINITDLSSLGQLGSTGSVTTMIPTTNMKLSLDGIKQQMNNGVWNILAGGSCGEILEERGLLVESIRFGEDAFSGCTLRLSYLEQFINYEIDWTIRCTQYQNIIWTNLFNPHGRTNDEDHHGLGIQFLLNKPDLLAIWPISKLNHSSEWVPIQNIMNYNLPPTPRGLNGYCYQLLIGQEIEIQYARFGSMIFPQYQIVGAKSNYIYGDIFFMKPDLNIEITQRVRFIDVTPTPETREKQRPYFLVRLPSDFFYPFM
ncbi:hypothetical protein MN116_002376 [Schistosoma mekongi]|uniref:Tectonic-1 n=1 Tax=Schistosoma mekongi TaxID=38744 RepID=A0AAE1ZK40_SCHME|nr:hypothetical protein MN116_002376 [Schistosoma mekongi]